MNYNSSNSKQHETCTQLTQQCQFVDPMTTINNIEENQRKQEINGVNDEVIEWEGLGRKQENKQKYRKCKEKLGVLCTQLLEQSQKRIMKDYSSESKSRLLALSIQLEKMALSQSKDYLGLEVKLKELCKILQLKRQNDLLILRQSRLLHAISCFLSKIPTLYKSQFNNSLKSLELGMKILQIFCTLVQNREHVISNNMLLILHNCLGVLIQKEEIRLANECLKVITQLISGHISVDLQQVVSLSLHIVPMSQFGRKIRQGIETCFNDKSGEQEFLLRILRYLYCFHCKIFQKTKQRPIYNQQELPNTMKVYSESIVCLLVKIIPKLVLENQNYDIEDEGLPIVVINILIYCLKLLNLNAHANVSSIQKLVKLNQNCLGKALYAVFKYSQESINSGQDNQQIQNLYTEIMQLVSLLCWNSPQNKEYFLEHHFIELLYNHPIKYMMDGQLKAILMPCLCAVMASSMANAKAYACENSTDGLISYLNKQKKTYESLQMKLSQQQKLRDTGPGEHVKLRRKSSESSFNSHTTQGTQNSSCYGSSPLIQDQKQMTKLLVLVPYSCWQALIDCLVQFEG